jgi:hypothetical protein
MADQLAKEGTLYKDSIFEAIIALAFMIIPPLVGPLPILYKLQTGQTIIIQRRADLYSHVATPAEIQTMIVAPLIISCIGYLLLREWKKTGIFVTSEGITKVRIGGQSMTIPWNEVDHVNRYVTTKGVGSLNIVGRGHMIAMNEQLAVKNGLPSLIRHHLPHIDFSPWEPSKLIGR